MKYKTRFTAFFAVVILMNLAANFAHPVTPTVIKNLHLHDYMFGVAYAMMQLTNFLFSPFWGKFNTYISSRNAMMAGCIGYGAAQLGFAVAATEPGIILARIAAGAFVGAIYVSYLTYIVNVSRPEDQGRYLTYCATMQTVAGAFGYLIGGFLGEISVRLSFYVQAFTLILCGVLFRLICENDADAAKGKIPAGRLFREANPFKAFVDSREFLTVMLAVLFLVNVSVNFAYTSFDQAFNYYLKDALNLTSSYNGVIKAAVGLVSFAANMTLCIWLIGRSSVHWYLPLLTGVSAAASAGMVLIGNIAPFIAVGVLLYASYSVCIPVLQHMVAQAASKEQKNLVMGFFNATKSLGSIAGSLTAGFIYALDKRLPFGCTFLLYVAATAAAVVCMESCEKRRRAERI